MPEERPLAAFAGLWRPWTGIRGTKANPVEGEHRLFGFLTTVATIEVDVSALQPGMSLTAKWRGRPVFIRNRTPEEIEAAKAVCRQCDVREECLQYAIDSNQEYGIWGGLTEEERRYMRRELTARLTR